MSSRKKPKRIENSNSWVTEMVDILFAGTGASVPSRERSLPCIAVRIKGNIILFDCGEGSQRQLMMSPFSFMKIRGIFVSHMHGDHFLGIPGLLQTMNMSGRKDKLTLAGPEGFSDAIASLLKMCGGGLNYEIDVKDAKDGDIFAFKGYSIEAFSVDHGIPALGFAFREDDRQGRFDREKAMSLGLQPGPDFSKLQEGKKVKGVDPKDVIGPERKGRVIVYSGDTMPCGRLLNVSKNADVLIHEATYLSKDHKLAKEHLHSTAKDAASLAKDADAGLLVVTHMSNRYDDLSLIEEECRSVFPNSIAATDMLTLSVKPRV